MTNTAARSQTAESLCHKSQTDKAKHKQTSMVKKPFSCPKDDISERTKETKTCDIKKMKTFMTLWNALAQFLETEEKRLDRGKSLSGPMETLKELWPENTKPIHSYLGNPQDTLPNTTWSMRRPQKAYGCYSKRLDETPVSRKLKPFSWTTSTSQTIWQLPSWT